MFQLDCLEFLVLLSRKDITELKNYPECAGGGRNILIVIFKNRSDYALSKRFYREESLNVGARGRALRTLSIIPSYEVCNYCCHIAAKYLMRHICCILEYRLCAYPHYHIRKIGQKNL